MALAGCVTSMRSAPAHLAVLASAMTLGAGIATADDRAGEGPRLGRAASDTDVRTRDLTIQSDGTGLPPGAGTVALGRATYAEKCAVCHGPAGVGGPADRLTGGIGSLTSTRPLRTVASYWPNAPALFDYIRRAMPLDAPQSLTSDEVYGLVAYLLSADRIVSPRRRLDARSLPGIAMPNRHGFTSLADRGFDGNIPAPPTGAPQTR